MMKADCAVGSNMFTMLYDYVPRLEKCIWFYYYKLEVSMTKTFNEKLIMRKQCD